jgi:hypothetical protein
MAGKWTLAAGNVEGGDKNCWGGRWDWLWIRKTNSPFSLNPSSTGMLMSFDRAFCPSCFCLFDAAWLPDPCFRFFWTILKGAIETLQYMSMS